MKRFNRLKWLHNINKKGVPGGAPFLFSVIPGKETQDEKS
jgi:hypothetical protein